MSRRLSEQQLPDFSQLIDRAAQLSLTQRDERGRGNEVVFDVRGAWPRLYVGRLWLRTLATAFGHNGHLAAVPNGAASRLSEVVSGEGGATC